MLEVETPLLSAAATTDPQLDSFVTTYTGPGAGGGRRLYLHTSPEYAMKRLVAAGYGSIYQIAKAFRNGEAGRLHNPEFTLLEWYRVGVDHHVLMREVEALVRKALDGYRALGETQTLSYREAFLRYVEIDPLTTSAAELERCAVARGIDPPRGLVRTSAWRDLLFTHLIEPQLGRGSLCFIHDYPAEQAALARLSPADPRVAERFELYIEGMEIANGFHELRDAEEQRRRLTAERAQREAHGLEPVPIDENFLAALAHGLPECAGVALGVDRLVMLAADCQHLTEVLAFSIERA